MKSNWKEAVSGLLDAYLGPVPESFEWEGQTYTPRSFADDFLKLNADDYLQVTSFVYQPYYAPMMIEVPDNWMWGSSWNLPLDEFMGVLDASLSEGYTLAWATDVSEKGFSIRNGLAINPDRNSSNCSDSMIHSLRAVRRSRSVRSCGKPILMPGRPRTTMACRS